jgi:hypothetical protein
MSALSVRVLRLIGVCVAVTCPAPSFAATYWVSPTGTSTWVSCVGETPLAGSDACSLATANGNLVAGDTVYLRGGTYTTHIFPARSGGGVSSRISYRRFQNEAPVIRNTTSPYATYYHGIALIGRHYIWIDGVKIDNPAGQVPAGKDRPLMITYGSSYNEISNCEIDGNGSGIIQMWKGDPSAAPVVHNWIHHSYIHSTGVLYWSGSHVDDGGGMQLGVPGHDNASGNNTIEDNVFACGGHHNLETFTKRNVIRNNFFRNEGCMANHTGETPTYGPDVNMLWGNRNLQVYDGHSSDGTFNLIEGNRFGPSGPPPDDDGGDGLTITSPKNIIRYNEIYGSQNNGVLMKMAAGSYSHLNRVYSNTIFNSGRHKNTGPQWQGAGLRFSPSTLTSSGNVFKNNIIYGNATIDIAHADQDGGTVNKNTLDNNWCTSDAVAGEPSACVGFGDPRFAFTDVPLFPATRIAPLLTVQHESPAVDAGTHLTTATAPGTNATLLPVADAMYFQDGTWGSGLAGHQADSIAVGRPDNVVRLASVDYGANLITLAESTTWQAGDRVWLYGKSDGLRVLHGVAPDIGAHERAVPAPPRGLRIVP